MVESWEQQMKDEGEQGSLCRSHLCLESLREVCTQLTNIKCVQLLRASRRILMQALCVRFNFVAALCGLPTRPPPGARADYDNRKKTKKALLYFRVWLDSYVGLLTCFFSVFLVRRARFY